MTNYKLQKYKYKLNNTSDISKRNYYKSKINLYSKQIGGESIDEIIDETLKQVNTSGEQLILSMRQTKEQIKTQINELVELNKKIKNDYNQSVQYGIETNNKLQLSKNKYKQLLEEFRKTIKDHNEQQAQSKLAEGKIKDDLTEKITQKQAEITQLQRIFEESRIKTEDRLSKLQNRIIQLEQEINTKDVIASDHITTDDDMMNCLRNKYKIM